MAHMWTVIALDLNKSDKIQAYLEVPRRLRGLDTLKVQL